MKHIRKRRFTIKKQRDVKYYNNFLKMPKKLNINHYHFNEIPNSNNYLFCPITLNEKDIVYGIIIYSSEDKNIYIYKIVHEINRNIDNTCTNIINYIRLFKNIHSQFESLPVIFIPESNMGNLPFILYTKFYSSVPNFYMYSEKDNTNVMGLHLTTDKKCNGIQHLKFLLQNNLLKIHESMNTNDILKMLKEFQNIKMKFNFRTNILVIYSKRKTTDYLLQFILLFCIGYQKFTFNDRIKFLTFKTNRP